MYNDGVCNPRVFPRPAPRKQSHQEVRNEHYLNEHGQQLSETRLTEALLDNVSVTHSEEHILISEVSWLLSKTLYIGQQKVLMNEPMSCTPLLDLHDPLLPPSLPLSLLSCSYHGVFPHLCGCVSHLPYGQENGSAWTVRISRNSWRRKCRVVLILAIGSRTLWWLVSVSYELPVCLCVWREGCVCGGGRRVYSTISCHTVHS